MLAGGFIGPKLTELITLDQFKFVFGWILIILAALMFWQTTPGYLAKNKKEQAILKEFKKRAEASAKAKLAQLEELGDGKQYLVDLSLRRSNPTEAENFGNSNPVQLRS